MNIGKSRDNFDKNKKLKCFNYNIYRYMVKKLSKAKESKRNKKVL